MYLGANGSTSCDSRLTSIRDEADGEAAAMGPDQRAPLRRQAAEADTFFFF